MKIVLADDDAHIRTYFATALKRRGHTVAEVGNGSAALQLFADCKGEIDILITDCKMGEGPNGIEVIRKVLVQNPNVRAYLISGFISGDDVNAALAAGAKEVFPKETSARTLCEKLLL